MRCRQRQELIARYQSAVRAYDGAVDAFGENESDPAWQRAELARKECDSARAELLHHEHDHGCVTWPPGANGSGQLGSGSQNGPIARIVNLFDVRTEGWEATQVVADGQLPAGKLAYQLSKENGAGEWIVDPTDLAERRHDGAELRYTEAGLKILREEGLEM